jgi:FecR protein
MKKVLLFLGCVAFGLLLTHSGFTQGMLISGGNQSDADTTQAELADYSWDEEAQNSGEELYSEVLYASGYVQVCMADEVKCVQVEEGLRLQSGDKLQVGDDSYVELSFDEAEENVVRVDSNSHVMLILKEDEKLELLKGRVFAAIDNLPSGLKFEIRTPTAVAGVRGTDWLTTVEGDLTRVEAISGEPYVKGFNEDGSLRSKAVVVKTGYGTTVKRFSAPHGLREISLTKIALWKANKKVIKNNAQETRSKRRKIPPAKRRALIKQRLKGKIKKQLDKKKDLNNNQNKNKPTTSNSRLKKKLPIAPLRIKSRP